MEDANGVVDWDVDIVGPDDGAACSKLAKTEDPDATECSSSFGDTLSGSDDDAKPSEISDIEVDSPFCRYPPNCDAAGLMEAAVAENLDRLLKKKKVTDHWRKYINPLMWRCQWLEMRMKDLQYQVFKYDRELEVRKHEKELQTKMIELDCSSSRSVPFASHCCRKTMKRRRRKKSEEKTNASSYISNHTILSYYEKTEADDHSIDDDGNLADDSSKGNTDADWLLGKGGDTTVEQIFLSIQSVQDRVFILRSNLKKAMANKSKGATLTVNTRINGAQSSNCSPGKGKVAGVLERSPQDTSDCDMDDADMPESAVSSYVEANNMDIFESTMSLLSAEDQQQLRELRHSSEDVLIDNQAAEEGYQNFEVISHPCKRLRVSIKRETVAHCVDESVAPTVAVKNEAQEGTTSFSLQGAIFKPCYTGKRTRRKPKIQSRGGLSASAIMSWRSGWIRKKKQFYVQTTSGNPSYPLA